MKLVSLVNFDIFSERIKEGIQNLKLSLISTFQIEQLYTFYQLLIKWNDKINLTAHRDSLDCIEKNFLDCLVLSSLISKEKNILDVGSGAGFPGLILKIIYNDLRICLIEANQKKSAFLEYVIRELSLQKIEVLSKRFEEKITDTKFISQFDTVVSRATIPITVFFKTLKNNLTLNTKVILMIGKSDFSEENFENFVLENKYFYHLPFSKLERGIFVFKTN